MKLFREVNSEHFGRLNQHTRLRFSALAGVSIGRACVEASHNMVNRKLLATSVCESPPHCLTSEGPAPDIRFDLVATDDEEP